MDTSSQLDTQRGHLDLVRSVALAANAALVIDDILDVALDAICAYLAWPVGIVWVSDGDVWAPRFWHADDDRLRARFRVRTGPIAASEGVLGALVSTGASASVWRLDDPTEPGAAVALEAGLPTSLAFSVRIGDEPVAVIQGFTDADRPPQRTVLSAMETICVQIARVIERDRSERDLRRSEAEFAAAQQLSRIGSWSWDVSQDRVRWSAQMYDNFGVAARDFDGTYEAFLQLVHPVDRPAMTEAIDAALAEGEPFTCEHRTATVPPRWIRCHASVERDADGDVRRLWGTAQDVTDIALRRTSQHRSGRVHALDPQRRDEALRELLLQEDLPHALDRDELQLQYQPVVELETGRMVGLEALVRWQPPASELIGSDVVIPMAEELGLISQLGAWVLGSACAQLSKWQQRRTQPLTMAVNVAPEQLLDPTFAETVGSILSQCTLPPEALVLEITESALIGESPHVAQQVSALRNLGVGVVIDDFGTGFSSLSRLRELSLDGLKIDRSFLVPVVSLHDDPPILRALFAVADHLELKVIAEGVETPAQLGALLRHGCDEAQGYLFSRPLSAERVDTLLEDPAGG